MITAQQFKKQWECKGEDSLRAFPENCLSDVRIPDDAKKFLIEGGFPDEAAPFLNFGPPKSGTLERVSVVYKVPTFDHYRIIGGNGSGDPVCLDENAEGQIVYLNHDSHFKRVLMASSVFTLAECLVLLRDVIADADDTEAVPPQRYQELLEQICAIDPAACAKNGFWPQEIGTLLPQKTKNWWQFWK